MAAQLRLDSLNDRPLSSDPRVALSIRESRRARSLILQVLPPRTIELVVPRGLRPAAIESFIEANRRWIDRAGLELIESFPQPESLPDTIELEALGKSIAVRYSDGASSSFRYAAGQLRVFSPSDRPADAAPVLRRWLLGFGRRHLKPWLVREAERTGLAPLRNEIRLQKTRWGSCSSSGTISLNAALLLIPADLVRYLLVHELCHLRHLNHSRYYWKTVERFEPEYMELDRRLGAAWGRMPGWLFGRNSGFNPGRAGSEGR